MKKTILTLALAALSVSAANAATVTGMTLADTINTDTNGAAAGAPDGLGADGKIGAFRFTSLNADTYSGAMLFGPANGGIINVSAATSPLEWNNGLVFAGGIALPFTTGPIVADITDGVLSISSLPFALYLRDYGDFVLNMTADSTHVLNLVQTGADTYSYRIGFSHLITSADDPSLIFVDQTGSWILEGTMSTSAVPIPAAAWLFGSGLLGLAGVVRRADSLHA